MHVLTNVHPYCLYCVAWRKDIRRVWGLPGSAHSEILPVISDGLYIMDELQKRSIKFIYSCVVSECAMVHRLARFALSVDGMNWILGQHAIFFSIGYGWNTCDVDRKILM